MEGTREGMTLALPTPECDADGNYLPTQCEPQTSECWCVDNFGTEIPKSRLELYFSAMRVAFFLFGRSKDNSTDCPELRKSIDCLDLTCRLGCEYGFILSEETGECFFFLTIFENIILSSTITIQFKVMLYQVCFLRLSNLSMS